MVQPHIRRDIMTYKFERLEVWRLALEYADLIYALAKQLPRSEDYNLKSQIIRAATSVGLNIAEGSTSQSDAEQARFLGLAIRSLIETVACQHMISRRGYLQNVELLRIAYRFSEKLFAKLQSLRSTLRPQSDRIVREEDEPYVYSPDTPF
jgi:four helix bundle protein